MHRVTVERTDKTVLIVRVVGDPNEPIRFLLRSDAHHDSVHTDRDLERKHLREACESGAYILDFGDLFDAMQGRFDPRRGPDRADLRPEYWQGHYLDRLVDVASDLYEPFADRWLLMSPGNHETGVAKRQEVDLTDRLVRDLRKRRPESMLERGSYAGWIIIRFCDSRRDSRSSHMGSLRLYYHHGYGGGGPVTRGVIQTARMGLYLPDADLVVSGHTHDHWTMPIARARVSDHGKVREDRQMHVRLAGYKGEFLDGEGWAIERGMPPKPRGGAWLTVSVKQSGSKNMRKIEYRIDEAA